MDKGMTSPLIPLCQYAPNITISVLFGRSFYDYG